MTSNTGTGVARKENRSIKFYHYGIEIICAYHGEKGVRRTMEDEHVMIPELRHTNSFLNQVSFFGIFDGHGGRNCVSFVKTTLPSEIINNINKTHFSSLIDRDVSDGNDAKLTKAESDENHVSEDIPDRDAKNIFYESFKKVDSRIATELPGCKDGCTAICLLMHKRQIFVAGLGDSQAYLARFIDNKIAVIPLSVAHRPWLIEEKNRLKKLGATIENGRINGQLEVSRSFGDLSLKKYGVSCIPTLRKMIIDCENDNFILLGCDGFWGAWTAKDAVAYTCELIEKEKRSSITNDRSFELWNVSKQLVDYVLIDKKSQDNISILVIYINGKNKAN